MIMDSQGNRIKYDKGKTETQTDKNGVGKNSENQDFFLWLSYFCCKLSKIILCIPRDDL